MLLKATGILLTLFLSACQTSEPRDPIIKKTGQFLRESVFRNKAMQEEQEERIQAIINRDTARTYLSSSNGFWYRYDKKQEKDTVTPHFGDLVTFNYDISTINGKTLYSVKEIGTREYTIDQEDLFIGLRKGLKMMKSGETITFFFPSSIAFGYYGDNDKIGHNIPIKSTVTLNSIISNTNLDTTFTN